MLLLICEPCLHWIVLKTLFEIVSFHFKLFFFRTYLLEELLVNRNNVLSKLKIRKLFASQEGQWWLLNIDWLIDWLLQMTCYVITTIVSANWKYKNFFASHGHTSYLSRIPRIYPCKNFLAGVNFYRFNAKNWT